MWSAVRDVLTQVGYMQLLLPSALLVLAGCVGSADEAGLCTQPTLTPAEADARYVSGAADPEAGCAAPNPTGGTQICVPGDVSTGRCCGDVGHAFYCQCGAWVCPQGTLPLQACSSHCEEDAGRVDAGS
jgi:hypothetical protein